MATMVLREGDEDGAVGHLVGELGHGAELLLCFAVLSNVLIVLMFVSSRRAAPFICHDNIVLLQLYVLLFCLFHRAELLLGSRALPGASPGGGRSVSRHILHYLVSSGSGLEVV